MKKYYLHDGITQTGPFDIEDLKDKRIAKSCLIWFEGLEDWTTVDKVEELNILWRSIPPPIQPQAVQQFPPVLHEPQKRNSIIRGSLTLGAVVALVLISIFIYKQMQIQEDKSERQSKLYAEEDIKATIRNNITSYVTADRSGYQYSTLGGISNLSISVNNNTDYLLDNVKVRVIYIKANGGVWDSRTIDFNLLNPHVKSTIRMPDTNRGTSVQYEIVSIKSSALGLN